MIKLPMEKHVFFFFNLFLFLAALGLRCCTCGLSLVAASGGYSCCRAQALGARASAFVVRGLSSCGSWALERKLSSCGAWA